LSQLTTNWHKQLVRQPKDKKWGGFCVRMFAKKFCEICVSSSRKKDNLGYHFGGRREQKLPSVPLWQFVFVFLKLAQKNECFVEKEKEKI
jgi:hypothetical protein